MKDTFSKWADQLLIQITKPELNSTFKILIATIMSAPYDLERVEAISIQEGKLLKNKDA